jgi:hypothetical protein
MRVSDDHTCALQEGQLKIRQEVRKNFKVILKNFSDVKESLKGLHTSARCAIELNRCLLENNGDADVPALVWVSPQTDQSSGGLDLWSKLDKWYGTNWLTETMVLHFVCPYTMAVVKCGPEGEGYEIKKARVWVKRHAKVLKGGIGVMRLALTAGRAVGIPLPQISLSDIMPEAVGEKVLDQIARLDEVLESLHDPSTSTETAPQQKLKPDKLKGDDYQNFKNWLEREHPTWKSTCQLKRVVTPRSDGKIDVEWVSRKNAEKWRKLRPDALKKGESLADADAAAAAADTAAAAAATAAAAAAAVAAAAMLKGHEGEHTPAPAPAPAAVEEGEDERKEAVGIPAVEIQRARDERGECAICGQRLYKVHMFGKRTPLTIEDEVRNGRCLLCRPLE